MYYIFTNRGDKIMAHKQCIDKLDKRCDCIIDDIIELEVIKNNIKHIDKLIKNYYLIGSNNEFFIKDLSNYLKLKLRIENEQEK
jgi:hypothetical protein